MLTVAVTLPLFIPDEEIRISQILAEGRADVVHLRKPHSALSEMERLIKKIPAQFRHRIKLHDHFELVSRYGLYGVHLNNRNPIPPDGAISVSKSCHSLEELDRIDSFDYVTLSPIFDSISKSGYEAAFDLSLFPEAIKGKRVVALGGVTPDKFDLLSQKGFYGAAMLGYFWK